MQTAASHKESLLIVEENAVVQSLIGEALQRKGYRVTQSLTAETGLQMYSQNAVDLVLTNIRFKNSDGLEFIFELKRLDPDVAVIVVANIADLDMARRTIAYGIYDLIPIPFELDQVVSSVAKACEKKMLLERNRLLIEKQATLIEKLHRSYMQLKELDKLKTEFLVTISYELLTPLTCIKSLTYNLLHGVVGELDPKKKEYAQLIMEDADRLEEILRDILNFSKLEAGKIVLNKEPVDVYAVVAKVVRAMQPIAEEKNITLRQINAKPFPAVSADRARLEEILANLIENALKFTPAGGKIEVDAADHPEEVHVTVRDTGMGIAPENLNKIFTQFTQFHREHGPGSQGIGLGLAIVKKLIEMHGGKITVQSQIQKGTTFLFSIPRQESKISTL